MRVLVKLEMLVVGIYRAFSSTKPPRCRFVPTCSSFALEAVERHGFLKGNWLTLKRLSRCRPLAKWGFDPVPDPVSRHAGH